MAHYMLGDEAAARNRVVKRPVTLPSAFPQKEEAQQRLTILTMDTQPPTGDARANPWTRSCDNSPKDPAALTRLARLQVRKARLTRQSTPIRKALDANPSFAPALRDLALIYSTRAADASKAFDVAAKARQHIRKMPSSPRPSVS
jgi:Flp pilus assembly protein TadD